MKIPQAHFGTVTTTSVDWRTRLKDEPDEDDDELRPTSADVIGTLGFDPATYEEEKSV